MISREEFIFTIGYDGPMAVVDGHAKKKYGGLSTAELAEKGMFRAAYASALLSGSPEELDAVIAAYNASSHAGVTRDSPLGRIFGVYPMNVARCKIL